MLAWLIGSSVFGAAAFAGAAAAITTNLSSVPLDGTNCFYANTWQAPRSGTRRHEGVDVIAKAGTPIYAVQRGRIVRSQGSLAGNQVKLVAGDGTYFIYAHLSDYADSAPNGSTVEAGTLIGYVGKTGNTSVNHLHFEVHPSGGKAVDPTALIAAVQTCGSKVSQQAIAKPSPWAGTTTTAPARVTTTVPKSPTTPASTAPPSTGTTIPPITVTPKPGADNAGATTTAPTTVPAPTSTGGTGGGGATAKTFTPAVVVLKQTTPIAANKTIGVTVVGFPGIPASSKSVDLSITITGKSNGSAAVWPCGSKAGLSTGTPLNPVTSGAASSTRVVLAPGDGGRVCMVSDVSTTVVVAVNAVG